MSAGARESLCRAPIIVREIERPRRAEPRFLRCVAVWIARRETPILRARGIELVFLFENFADTQHRARRTLTRRKVRDHAAELPAREIVLRLVPINQRER